MELIDLIKETKDILGIALAFVFIGLVALFRDRLYKLFSKYLMDKGSSSALPWKTFTAQHEQINNLLIELRAIIGADRVYVYQFHNGGTFLPNTSAWRITSTFEVCGRGISYQGQNVQGVPITRLWDIMLCLFPLDQLQPSPISTEHNIRTSKNVLVNSVYSILTEQLQLGFSRNFLENSNTEVLVLAPLFDEKKNIIGCLCADYCDVADYNKALEDDPLVFEQINTCAGLTGLVLSVKTFTVFPK